jgi:hypothetical protein
MIARLRRLLSRLLGRHRRVEERLGRPDWWA